MAKVYFTSLECKSTKDNIPNKIKKLFEKAEFQNTFSKGEQVAIKLHFGERGNTTYMHPVYVRQMVDKVKEYEGVPFLTDTNTLYSGYRTNSPQHLVTAIENGFAYAVVNAPIIIADGLFSKDSVEVDINKNHFERVKIASGIYNAQSMIVMSHFKGHEMAGFGGAIKNLAMGCASAAGKQMQHSDVKPVVKEAKCVGCQRCAQGCPVKAIKMENRKAIIDPAICYGCGECVTVCPVRAINVNWDTDSNIFLEKMAEYALGAVNDKKDKVAYMSFVVNVTPHCDCVPWSGRPIAQDIGIFASTDPVALDQACHDKIVETCGHDVFNHHNPKVQGLHILEYAESIGLGSRNYELVEL